MKELLVPIGNMDSLMIAINAGADAVYLAGKKYGARASAVNFDDEEMIRAIKLCHLYGVKIYVTVNTLIYESEFSSVVKYVEFLYVNGVDAVIIQDLGLISYLRKHIPDLEIHASTQVHNTNDKTLEFLKNLGVKRVVLARELSVDEINNFKTDIELEAFIHGAICVSYSGQCLFSSHILNRSGNRGECAQMCRLPYTLFKGDEEIKTDGNYLISPRELNTSSSFDKIMKSNIYSLKIEGRLKSKEYVGCVTKLYRSLIDEYQETGKCHVNKELLKDLSVIFNRKFTEGFILNSSLNDLMNIEMSNHQGTYLGDVVDVYKKYIKIRLEDDINQEDGIRFTSSKEGMIANFIYDIHGKLINSAKKGNIILLDNRFNVKKGDKLVKTFSVRIRDKYTKLEEKKISINMFFSARIGKSLLLRIDDGVNEVVKTYGSAVAALKTGTDEERISSQLGKLGGTPFIIKKLDLDVEKDVFINIKDINEIRRLAVDELIKLREGQKRVLSVSKNNTNYDLKYNDEITYSFLVRSEYQLKYLLNKAKRIYVTDKQLFNKYKNYPNVYYQTNRVKDDYQDKALITELGAIKNGGITDYFLNATNHETINLYSRFTDIVTLSSELIDDEIINIMDYYNNKANLELVIYGRIELMLMKYCPLNYLVNKDKICSLCIKDQYYLASGNKDDLKKYPIITDIINHTTHILNHEITNKFDNIDFYKNLGIRNFRIELFDESEKKIDDILKNIEE